MKVVYRINQNSKGRQYSYDMPESEMFAISNREFPARLKGESISDWWEPVPCFATHPLDPALDFFAAGIIGQFAVSERVFEDSIARGLLEQSGEFLPLLIPEEGRTIHFFRPVAWGFRTEAFDEQRSVIRDYRDAKFVFIEDALPPGGTFGLPRKIDVFVVHDPAFPPEKDFRQWYQLKGYTGLRFEELWREEAR